MPRDDAAAGPDIPWYLWCAALAVTSAYIGGYWDISWHRSIGRDTFWTAPHLAIYACGVLAAVSSGYLILVTTFQKPPQRTLRPQSQSFSAISASSAVASPPLGDVSVRIWGLRGPLGAFECAWGGVAMLVSAPFDDWWHSAYGLDVRILSPPHVVLALGFFSIAVGTLTMLIAFMNRATGARREALQRLFLYVAGVALCESLLLTLEYIDRSAMHSAIFYRVVVTGTPGILIALGLAARHRWACTIMAGVYSAFSIILLWLLPLFSAQPKLGPVYHQVSHFVPWEFPLLIVIPAMVIDLVLRRTESWPRIARGMVAGLAFFAVFLVVQWPFGNFMNSPLARNWMFGAHYIQYNIPTSSAYARYLFIPREPTAQAFWRGMFIAVATSSVGAYVGTIVGGRLQRVRR